MSAIEDEGRAQQTLPTVKIFLCGDVMTGRGIDQVLPLPCAPQLHEQYMTLATDYVSLAEQAHGAIAKPVDPAYIWGVSLEEMQRQEPAARIINLEMSITRCEDFSPKGINYRTSPENAVCLTAADIDCCVLANNHVLDFGRAGLIDTLSALERLNIRTAGAGRDLNEATAPAVIDIGKGSRLIILACVALSSGVPLAWAARRNKPGVNLCHLSDLDAEAIADQVARVRRLGDIVVVSIHWGSNWGYDVPDDHTRFARRLIDIAGVSVVHGHSSHHPRAIEIYRNRLILYGCGDFLNDYEGIRGYERFRSDLSLMYFATIDRRSGNLSGLEMVPLQIRRFQLIRASREDCKWLGDTLDRESRRFGAQVEMTAGGALTCRPV